MTDDLQRRGLLADLARQSRGLSLDAVRVLDRIASRLVRRQQRDLTLTLGTMRTWTRDQWGRDLDDGSETLDDAIAAVADQLVLEDQELASRREAARAEMVGGPVQRAAHQQHREHDAAAERYAALRAEAIEAVQIGAIDPELGREAIRVLDERQADEVHIGRPGDRLTGQPIVVDDSEDG